MYSFAMIGMDLFGNLFDYVQLNTEYNNIYNNNYFWGDNLLRDINYQTFNFDTFGNALHQTFIGLVANNWIVFMFGYANIMDIAFKNNYFAPYISYLYNVKENNCPLQITPAHI